MKAASINEIKQELKAMAPQRLAEVCLRLARYKKENKELLTYLLFEAADPDAYTRSVKEEISEAFTTVPTSHLYFAKKNLRKILRLAQKYIRYAGSKTVEADVLLHYCRLLKALPLPHQHHQALNSLYQGGLKKIRLAISSLHEDLQHDFLVQLEELEE
ncbi:hypothetical protein V9K67_18775 [Paraflavisolibacter sp. H34]|uniref:hypothetical protein n=1 Tax=Huijunlia imazamoxiresistens TaxID=3127457 RepID=UPI003017C1B8